MVHTMPARFWQKKGKDTAQLSISCAKYICKVFDPKGLIPSFARGMHRLRIAGETVFAITREVRSMEKGINKNNQKNNVQQQNHQDEKKQQNNASNKQNH